MFLRPSSLVLLTIAVLSLLGSSAVLAFAPQSQQQAHSQVGRRPVGSPSSSQDIFNGQTITWKNEMGGSTAILAAKKPTNTEEEKKQVVDPLELFILFMTPWRNPNSIFVYMLIIINILGRMQESQ
jgi:hypothetical protein